MFFFFKQKTAYEMRISDWSSDVCSSDLYGKVARFVPRPGQSTPRGASSFSVFGAIDATGTSWCAGVRQGNAGRAPEGSSAGAARLHRRPAARRGKGRQPAGPAGEGSHGTWRPGVRRDPAGHARSEEHTSELQSLMLISYAVFCL